VKICLVIVFKFEKVPLCPEHSKPELFVNQFLLGVHPVVVVVAAAV
jgi:hypothetical protein